jgi:hypothetical protein
MESNEIQIIPAIAGALADRIACNVFVMTILQQEARRLFSRHAAGMRPNLAIWS